VTNTIKLEVKGAAEVEKMLRELAPKEAKKAMRKALRDSAKYVKAKAQRNAPVDTGLLRRKLKIRAAKRSGGKRFKRGRFGVGVYSGLPGKGQNTGEAFYGYFHEVGTKQRKTKAGHNRGKLEPNPWLAPALYRNKNKVRQFFVRSLRRHLRALK